jgi:hypothetical protein
LDENAIAIDQRIHDLANDETVREANDKTVLGRLVLVLVLADETLSLTVVRPSLAASTELDLKAGKVGLVLLNFDKRLPVVDEREGR